MTTITQQAQARSLDMPWDIAPRYDGVIIGFLALALVVGWGAGLALGQQTTAYSDSDLPFTLRYPSGWGVERSGGGLLLVNLEEGAAFHTTFQVATNRVAPGADLPGLADERISRQAGQLDFFQVETNQPGPKVGGQPSQRITYRYVTLTSGGPVVVRGADTLLVYNDRLYVYRYVVEAPQFDDSVGQYERILSTVRYQ